MGGDARPLLGASLDTAVSVSFRKVSIQNIRQPDGAPMLPRAWSSSRRCRFLNPALLLLSTTVFMSGRDDWKARCATAVWAGRSQTTSSHATSHSAYPEPSQMYCLWGSARSINSMAFS